MQKLIETLKSFGIEIPADKQADVKKALSEHYKNAAEHNKAISKLEADRDAWKEKAESAEETLKGFEGIDPAQVQSIKRKPRTQRKTGTQNCMSVILRMP